MAGLDDINPNDPAGPETPTLGDNRIRALAAKIIEAFGVEHALSGPHTFFVGSAAERPAAGHAGRFYILTAAGVKPEIQYDTGSAWVTITCNEAVSGGSGVVGDLAAHIAATPIDHPNASVIAAKIAQGAVLKRHLDGSGDATDISALVDGSNADAFHSHGGAGDSKIAVFTSSGVWTCPAGITLVLSEEWGGGGGGGGHYSGYGDAYGGGGAGAGGYAKVYHTVVPGNDYAVAIGLGGTGGSLSNDGLSGGNTSFDTTIYAYGGTGGQYSRPEIPGNSGVGGGHSHYPGQYGCSGQLGNPSLGSGGTAGGFGGIGGPGGVGGPGENGSFPGGGGGGGFHFSTGIGGNGASGLAILRW